VDEEEMTQGQDADVLIIGGGPAGASAAAVLAMHGRKVLVLEKEKFPRYHVGESLMPFCYFPLERIGALKKVQASHFPKKYSVQFVRMDGHQSQPFYFFQHSDHPSTTTWQVPRDEFDQLLLDNAREKGAEVIEEITVKDVIANEEGTIVGVSAVDKDGQRREFRAPMTIDASGRDSLAQLKAGWRVRDGKLNKLAIWTYYKGAQRDSGYDEGATTVAYLPNKGWYWYIPLPNDVVSVGLVAEKEYLFRGGEKDLATIFQRSIPENVWIRDHLATGQPFGPYRITGEYSYRSRHCASDGLLLAGDAFAFLDPVFSSGVFLALKTGEMAGDAVHAALTAGDFSAAQFKPYSDTVCAGLESMRKLVYAFYDEGFSFKQVFMKDPSVRGRLTDCLIGDLFTDFDSLFRVVGEFAALPPPLTHGGPLVRAL
jgi:flavin-dependent dehydrogenase